MIDDFLRDLFTPDAGPASFAARFQPAIDRPLAPAPEPEMSGGVDDDLMRRINGNFLLRNGGRDPSGTQVLPDSGALPPNASPMSGSAPASMIPPGGVPLPRPRPADLGAILAGNGPMSIAPPPSSGMPTAAPPLPDFMDRLKGVIRNPLGDPNAPEGGAQGILGRLMGIDASREKRLRSALAGGFAGGNPAFAGGAFMKGASGGLSGGLKSDKDDLEAETAADERDQKQANWNRAQSDKERTSEALRKLYGMRGDVMKQNADTRAASPGTGKSSWNKPPHERYKDAMKLIQDERKALYGQINPLGPKADVQKQRAEADKRLQDFTDRTLKTYGIDRDGNELPESPQRSGTPSSRRVIGDQEAKDTGLYPKGTYDDPAEPMSQEEFEALPAGTIFKNPADGRLMTKRG